MEVFLNQYLLYLLNTYDIPEIETIKIATFADDISVLTKGSTIKETTGNLQNGINSMSIWLKEWLTKNPLALALPTNDCTNKKNSE